MSKETLQAKLDLLKQVVHLVEMTQSKEEALDALRRLLVALEAEYEVALLEDPMIEWVVASRNTKNC